MTILAKSALLIAAPLFLALCREAAADVREWRFDVTADGIPIGTHRFIVSDEGDTRTVQSDMHFRVRVLAFDAYQYDHHATETWQNDCLSAFETRTDERGSVTAVRGHRASDRFEVDGAAGPTQLPSCVMTFAYWNPRVLTQSQLINSQTGAWTPVTNEKLGREEIVVRGQSRIADHYRLRTAKNQIELWYSADRGDWLAMRTRTNSGHVLAYQLR
jgi:Domain of unknown function (DUF6134)